VGGGGGVCAKYSFPSYSRHQAPHVFPTTPRIAAITRRQSSRSARSARNCRARTPGRFSNDLRKLYGFLPSTASSLGAGEQLFLPSQHAHFHASGPRLTRTPTQFAGFPAAGTCQSESIDRSGAQSQSDSCSKPTAISNGRGEPGRRLNAMACASFCRGNTLPTCYIARFRRGRPMQHR